MWLVIQQRQPRPDASVWPGRTALAVVDAVAFPSLWILAATRAPLATELLGAVVAAGAALLAARRLSLAIWHNERYRFTAWRWGRVIAPMLLVGLVLRVALRVS